MKMLMCVVSGLSECVLRNVNILFLNDVCMWLCVGCSCFVCCVYLGFVLCDCESHVVYVLCCVCLMIVFVLL